MNPVKTNARKANGKSPHPLPFKKTGAKMTKGVKKNAGKGDMHDSAVRSLAASKAPVRR